MVKGSLSEQLEMKRRTMSCQDFTLGKANLIFEELKLNQFELALYGSLGKEW